MFSVAFHIGAVFILLFTPMLTPLYGLFFLSSVISASGFIINQGIVLSSAPINVAGSFAAILNIAPSGGRMVGHFAAGFFSQSFGQRESLMSLAGLSCIKFFLIPYIFKEKGPKKLSDSSSHKPTFEPDDEQVTLIPNKDEDEDLLPLTSSPNP